MQTATTQSGAVLVVGLIILLVLTMIGITAVQTTTLEEHMAGNARNANVAFQAAESALRDGEEWVMTIDPYNMPNAVSTCSTAPCDLWNVGDLTSDFAGQSASWWKTNGREYGTKGTRDLKESAFDPYFTVEYLGQPPVRSQPGWSSASRGLGEHFFRVTAYGVGGDGSARAVLQTTVRIEK